MTRGSRGAAAGLVVVVALVLFPADASARVRRRSLGATNLGGSALALDGQQRPHVAYQGSDYKLHHAWLDGRAWRREVVDAASDCGWGSSIAIDGLGRIHIAYHSERMEPYRQTLSYALHDGASWQITDVGDGGYSTSIALDAENHPHVLHFGKGGSALMYAEFDGSAWRNADTLLPGLYAAPTGIALDAAGKAHVTFTQRTGDDIAVYAGNATGSWVATALCQQSGGYVSTALALDGLQRPRVAVTVADTVRLFSHDGADWQQQDIYSLPGITQRPDAVALALDDGDRAHVLLSTYVSLGDRGGNVTACAFHDGTAWAVLLVDANNAGFNVALAVDDEGTMHGTYRTGRGDKSTLQYVRIALPDLGGAFSAGTISEAGGAHAVGAVLTVDNHGADSAKGAPIAFYLSDDAVVDGADEVLPIRKKSPGLRPGAAKAVPVTFTHAGPVAGRYLIAVLDPAKALGDRDATDNTVALLLGD